MREAVNSVVAADYYRFVQFVALFNNEMSVE
jgi:hypothetical protein